MEKKRGEKGGQSLQKLISNELVDLESLIDAKQMMRPLGERKEKRKGGRGGGKERERKPLYRVEPHFSLL